MKKYRTETQEVEVLDDILCNRCGKSCMRGDEDFTEPYGLIEAEVVGGYESTELQDSVVYKFSICEQCMAELFAEFHIEPESEGGFCCGGSCNCGEE